MTLEESVQDDAQKQIPIRDLSKKIKPGETLRISWGKKESSFVDVTVQGIGPGGIHPHTQRRYAHTIRSDQGVAYCIYKDTRVQRLS